MATQRHHNSIENEQCWVDEIYDDATMIVSRVEWANNLTRPAYARVWRGTTVILDAVIPPAPDPQSSGSRNLSGPNRYNINDDAMTRDLSA
jgi:hypothetical protein